MHRAQSAETVPTENLQKLSGMQATGTPMSAFQPVPQNDEYAAQLRKNLEQVKLPPGFKINLYAVVPDARHIAVGPQGVVTFVGTRKDAMWAITDRNKDGAADEVKRFAPSLAFDIPNGPCFSKDGFLYIAERNRILVFPAAEFFYESPDIAVGQVVKQGELIPKEEESFNHTARVCRIGPDKKLYVQLGQPYNVQPKEKLELYEKVGIGGIVRMNQDGSEKEVYSIGHRNPVGMDFHPTTGELWTNDNQVDGLGDDTPPGELNRITGPGQHFGFPYLNGACGFPTTRTWSRRPKPWRRWWRRHRMPPTSACCSIPATSSRPNTRRACSPPSTARGTAPNRSARACCSRRSTMTAPPRASRKSSPWAG